ncbi:MAG: hypothetical protein JW820_13610, partial [Spirochaetales bacterium]|nr:hypothetical protein [Spirochaetales bacterium]
GVVEYACKVRAGGAYEPWLSLGTQMSIRDVFLSGYDIKRNYFFDLRVRGAGGLTINRQGGFDLEFFDPETHAAPFTSSVDTSDDSPPVEPWVSLADTATAVDNELYAQWQSADPESGIQRYEYAVGVHSAPESAGQEETEEEEEEQETDDGGGFYLPGFGSALELANGVVGGAQVVGGAMADVLANVVPWTDAGGRTEAIIKNLELQHGYEYVVSVRATNGVGLQSIGTSDPILVDLTPPEGIEIVELVQEAVDGYPNSVKFEFTFGEDPETEVAAHYFALGSSPTTDDLFPWTEAVLNFGKIADLPVAEGSPVYLLVKGVNLLGLEAVVVAELELDYSDGSPPPAPTVVTDPQASSGDGSSLAVGWNRVLDLESGILSYAYGISSEIIEDPAAEPDILAWVAVDRTEQPYYIGKRVGGDGSDLILPGAGDQEEGAESGESEGAQIADFGGFGYVQVGVQVIGEQLGTDYEVRRTDLNLSGPVYAAVRVTNGAGLSTVACSPMILFDATPPEGASIQAQPQQTNLGMLELTLDAADRESGIESYRYEVYPVQAGPSAAWAVSTWRNADAPAQGAVSRTVQISAFPPPGLQYGESYDVRLWVRNRAGLTRATNLVTIEMVPPEGEGEIKPDQEGVIDLRREPALPPVRRAP